LPFPSGAAVGADRRPVTRRDDQTIMQPRALATLASNDDVFPLRERYRKEMNCQIVHDSIHSRPGWTMTYLLTSEGTVAGFGSTAIGGPWSGKPTVFEFFVLPEHRMRAFDLFEALLAGSGARFMEIQSSDMLLSVMLYTYARDIWSEKIVFHDKLTTALPSDGAVLRSMTPEEETRRSIDQRQGGPEWQLEVGGEIAATGGILFHYNRPYGDIYMEVNEPFRRRGLGAYLVQELKRLAYELNSIPCARCSPSNTASRRTLQKAGFVPCASILNGSITSGPEAGS
jgi:GNAT superfamily N-acetyltransferase